MKKTIVFISMFAVMGLFIGFMQDNSVESDQANVSNVMPAVGDPEILKEKYEAWKTAVLERDSAHLVLTLVPHNTHVKSAPVGRVNIDLETAKLTSNLHNLDTNQNLGLWMAQEEVIYSVNEEKANNRFVGQFSVVEDRFELEADISRILDQGYKIDQLIVAPMDSNPLQSGILAGSPDLFQRLLAAEMVVSEMDMGEGTKALFNAIFPAANAFFHTGFPYVFNDLVAEGEHVFLNETFSGNGRTCGTCHSPLNNFTIDVPFIPVIADEPVDKLQR